MGMTMPHLLEKAIEYDLEHPAEENYAGYEGGDDNEDTDILEQ